MPDSNRTNHSNDTGGGDFPLSVDYRFRLRFTRDVFAADNSVLAGVFPPPPGRPHRVLVCIDQGVLDSWPELQSHIDSYFAVHRDLLARAGRFHIVPAGEAAKNDPSVIQAALNAIHEAGICRQSFVMVIGGGAVLDVVGFAAATAHRGVRLVRLPTTTLAQDDAGIGVKNGVNAFGKKNFLGSFAAPWAVINDANFLQTLDDRTWRCGLSEAVKVALVKDAAFFDELERIAPRLLARDESAIEPVIQRCALLHLKHIMDGGDPFELTQARPLDFGHWAAHKLEQMSNWQLPHGETVAIGIALDVTYASLLGMLSEAEAQRILACFDSLGFALFDSHMDDADMLMQGLEEFREHLGGELTVQMLEGIGKGVDVHEIDRDRMIAAIGQLRRRSEAHR